MIWDVSPVALSFGPWNLPWIGAVGPLELRWYSMLFALGFVYGTAFFHKIYEWENKPKQDLDTLLTYMVAATIIGARLGHTLFYEADYYLSHPFEILKVWRGGLASHGAAVAILIALITYSKNRPDQPFSWIVDRMTIFVATAGGFIRLGNFMNSEIIGRPADVPWAVIFKRVDDVPRHPTQLYEAACYFIIAALMHIYYLRRRPETRPFALLGFFLVSVFGVRFVLEFFKENQVPFEEGLAFNMGQILSVPLVALGILLLTKKPSDSAAHARS